MTIENSTLNEGPALRESNAAYTGASGDGCPDVATLKRGFAELADPQPQLTYFGEGVNRGGFLTRPQGWER
jgi:hypothetical protein